jgi:hypothetical protein
VQGDFREDSAESWVVLEKVENHLQVCGQALRGEVPAAGSARSLNCLPAYPTTARINSVQCSNQAIDR